MATGGASNASINSLRAKLRTIYNRARKAAVYTGTNAAADTEHRRATKSRFPTLRAEHADPLLQAVPDQWRALFATALFLGLRKGELFGMRVCDVDLITNSLVVQRSHDANNTKGGHADTLPIPAPLVPFLADAIGKRPRDAYLFARADGSIRPRHAKPEKILRSALKRIGVNDGFRHICRRCVRKGTPHIEEHPDEQERRCPRCKMILWPSAKPSRMRFHDLRHSTATLLLRAGVPAAVVQRILRHSDVRLTVGTYGHLDLDDMRASLEQLPAVAGPFVGAEPVQGPPEVSRTIVISTGLSTRLLPERANGESAHRKAAEKPNESGELEWRALLDSNQWPSASETDALSN